MVIVTAALLLIVTGIYLLNKYYLTFWKRRGFPQQSPSFLFGDTGSFTLGKESLAEFYENLYNKTKKHDTFGFYNFYQPTLLVNNPELIKKILVSDFNQFHDRAVPLDETNDPLIGNLFFLAGQKWRDLRVKLSPTFTSGKLKLMFPIIQECVETLNSHLKRNMDDGIDTFEAKSLFARYTTNIISSVAFGIENDCINDPENRFYRLGKRIFEPTLNNIIRNFSILMPSLYRILRPKFVEKKMETFFVDIVRDTIAYREREKIVRNDFMNLLIQLKNQGYKSVDGANEDKSHQNLNLLEIAAQAFVFFIASFETTSTTMTFCLFEIARNPKIQQRLQEEIDGLDEVNFETFSKLKYVEACIDETLRKYSSVSSLIRESANDYKIPDSNLVIPKGASIHIPIFALHRDPSIYDNPLEFNPDRFLDSPTGNGKVNGLFYLPFGDGPRNCIGM